VEAEREREAPGAGDTLIEKPDGSAYLRSTDGVTFEL
jgi:hypothetical protein